jgi:sulfite exporter TauE/SafE/copper chaperone CopZ
MEPATTTRIIRVPVAGMTCAACTHRVGTALRAIPGVQGVEVSLPRGTATLTSSRVPSDEELSRQLAAAGYELGRTRWLSGDRQVWGTFAVALVAVTALVLAALGLGIAGIPARLSTPGGGGLILVGLVGLAAGVSTCMALVGGLVLSISAAHAASAPPDSQRSFAGRMRPHLVFTVGRIAGFVVLGALLGTIGGAFPVPARLMGVVILAVAAVMAILGIRLTEVSPRVAAWSPHLPTGLAAVVSRGSRDKRYSDLRAAALGAATFLLPCGFTQAVQLYALTTGSAVSAGLIMGVFALGTTPGLLTLAAVPEVATAGRRRGVGLRVIGVVVLAFALVNASAGLRLIGWTSPADAPVATSTSPNVTLNDGVQTVTMTQTPRGYTPADTVVHAGIPISWVVESTSRWDCSAFLRVPSTGTSVDLQEGRNVIDLPPLPVGTTSFTCVMGMYSGTLQAIPAPQPAAT